jgi:hypothetical protein
MVYVEVVDMTDENKETQQETKEAHDGGMGQKLKRRSTWPDKRRQEEYSIAQSGAVWCSMEAEVSVK